MEFYLFWNTVSDNDILPSGRLIGDPLAFKYQFVDKFSLPRPIIDDEMSLDRAQQDLKLLLRCSF